jgi:uncharacterized 2Fe-2S/4Fe-4S cluster protein (DUF4445 family)
MQIPELLTPKPDSFRVTFVNVNLELELSAGETLLQGARRAGLRIAAACGGRGSCGNCLVRVLSGRFTLLHPDKAAQRPAQAGSDWLRACQLHPASDLEIEISPRALIAEIQSELAEVADEPAFAFDPVVTCCDVDLDAEAGERPFAAAVKRVLQEIPSLAAASPRSVKAIVRDRAVIGCVARGRRPLGLALDLGTTNLAGSLTDLENGERLVSLGRENPQAAYGADLVSRINHAITTPQGGSELQASVVKAINSLVTQLCAEILASPEEIADIAICGNTAMHHLLLKLPVRQLGRAPFVPYSCDAMDLKARDLGLHLMPGACVHLLPNIGGFVGGDHVATLLATEQHWSHGTSLVVDIGTNTEISLIHNGSITTASAASGPALEGGNLSCGMRAAEGAIEKIWLSEGQIMTQVIGAGSAVGLCGSGVLDALATLRLAGIINQRGYILPDGLNVITVGDARAYAFTPEVVMTQQDVRAVLLAKAAIRAAIETLLQEADLTETALEMIVIAGAFGVYLDIANAMAIGLLPTLPVERCRQVGNAAGVGVRMALASQQLRAKAVQLAGRCRHIELNSIAKFQKTFIRQITI